MGSWTNWHRTRFPVPGPSDGRLLPGAELFQRKWPGWCRPPPTATTDKSSTGGPCTGRAHGQYQLLRKVRPRQVNGLWPDRKPYGFPLCSGPTALGRNIQKLHRSTLHRPEPPVREPGQRAAAASLYCEVTQQPTWRPGWASETCTQARTQHVRRHSGKHARTQGRTHTYDAHVGAHVFAYVQPRLKGH